jgi:hypothetical protein
MAAVEVRENLIARREDLVIRLAAGGVLPDRAWRASKEK